MAEEIISLLFMLIFAPLFVEKSVRSPPLYCCCDLVNHKKHYACVSNPDSILIPGKLAAARLNNLTQEARLPYRHFENSDSFSFAILLP